jgi:hypothetical protein
MAAWIRALGATRAKVVLWDARAIDRPVRVAARIAEKLGDRGALVRTGSRILWFEVADPKPTTRGEWLRLASGALARLEGGAPAERGDVLRAKLESSGRLEEPKPFPPSGVEDLTRIHARLFPDGVVLRVGHPSPPAFLGLEPAVRQAIWRDGMRWQRGIRSRSGWFVTVYAPEGSTEVLFAAPRPVKSAQAAEWYAKLAPYTWRLREGDASRDT